MVDSFFNIMKTKDITAQTSNSNMNNDSGISSTDKYSKNTVMKSNSGYGKLGNNSFMLQKNQYSHFKTTKTKDTNESNKTMDKIDEKLKIKNESNDVVDKDDKSLEINVKNDPPNKTENNKMDLEAKKLIEIIKDDNEKDKNETSLSNFIQKKGYGILEKLLENTDKFNKKEINDKVEDIKTTGDLMKSTIKNFLN